MNEPKRALRPSRGALLALLVATGAAIGQSGGPYELERARVDAGAASAVGGVYTLEGTAGQPEAGHAARGAHEQFGGFHAPDSSDRIFADSYE